MGKIVSSQGDPIMARLEVTPTPMNTKKAAAEFRKKSDKYVAAATTSKQKARNTLVKLGIYTPRGKLSKAYSK